MFSVSSRVIESLIDSNFSLLMPLYHGQQVKAEEVQSLCGAIEQLFLVHRDLSDGIVTRAERGVCADDCGRFIFQVVRRMGCYFKFAVVYAQTREWVRTQSTKQLKSWLGKVGKGVKKNAKQEGKRRGGGRV